MLATVDHLNALFNRNNKTCPALQPPPFIPSTALMNGNDDEAV